MPDTVRRSREMVMAAYFLARWGEVNNKGKTDPPSELKSKSWKHAYSCFYAHLGEGRSLRSFCNSLKNARDVYDAHIPTGRIGWRESGADRVPAKLPALHVSVRDEWKGKRRGELWGRVQKYSDLSAGAVVSQILDDVDVQLGESESRNSRTEGGKKVAISSRTERDPALRNDAIRIHGTKCQVCKWDFGEIYGTWGKGYVEVHHLVPLGLALGLRETDPKEDLAVLCANCHRMVHRKRNLVLTIDELRSKIDFSALARWVEMLEQE